MRPISTGNITTFVTKMTKKEAIAPIIALEGAVIVGRTYQANKRGGWEEARERFIEETIGSLVWLFGVGTLNSFGDKLLKKILKTRNVNFDVGTDKILRTPFENYMQKIAPKGFSKKQVALLKGSKVLTSIILTNLFIGLIVPKLNQGITNLLRKQKQENSNNVRNYTDNLDISTNKNKTSNPSFKGFGISAINTFTNAIENTTTGKLLSSDFGIASGRMYSARTKEERREVAIRDIGSIYFYMWAQGHTRNLLNLAESGNTRRLDPATAEILTDHLKNIIGDADMPAEEFRKLILGNKTEIPSGLNFETINQTKLDKLFKRKPLEVIKYSELEKLITDPVIRQRLKEMSKLQPLREGEAVLTKRQVYDSINIAEINNPKLLEKAFMNLTDGNSKEEFKYVSNKELYKLKDDMEYFVELLCKKCKNKNVNKKAIDKALSRNVLLNGINFAAGFGLAAAFLSTYIPKIQYYVTRKTTGVDAFPGTYNYNKKKTPQKV